ncbi:hypothetical protein [Bradyrhizobium brasilense]|uniref:Restriction system protein Mrr-like N-terminal domain-containing protein n=1 Tax=Bradyrhizobium brasilense TaxID=1419277 RepID=A0ABY8J6V9_9BRAD|nr:hypothetical protein [Bradyrhizobium brasilense]WFU61280.1 hypothetical protein QA636_27680 [Bradyrhizobium brasilense]
MNFQVTVLKILVSYPGGVAPLVDLKRDMAILVTSGSDWGERTKRLAACVPNLNIFSQGLVERENGAWRITDKGREVLQSMEASPVFEQPISMIPLGEVDTQAAAPRPPAQRAKRRRERRDRRREARERARAAS